jgi:polysaccharide deacetylase family protein (PEP-CTERM system associated)
MINALSVDVEEYFHPTEVPASAHPDTWAYLPSRITAQVRTILDLLEQHQVKATFFVLGWIAERHPELVRRIADAGHEIGCHSYAHRLVYNMSADEFRLDTQRAIVAIEDACGIRPVLYRAPSYSILERSLWALEILAELGFQYDSSIYPIHHDRCGIPGFGRGSQIIRTAAGPLFEVPIATVQLSQDCVAPVGGGGYLRLLPYSYTAAGIRRMNSREGLPACIYFHPWELDAEQPRMATAPLARLRTYMGIRGMLRKLNSLLSDFEFSTLTAVYPLAVEEVRVAVAK